MESRSHPLWISHRNSAFHSTQSHHTCRAYQQRPNCLPWHNQWRFQKLPQRTTQQRPQTQTRLAWASFSPIHQRNRVRKDGPEEKNIKIFKLGRRESLHQPIRRRSSTLRYGRHDLCSINISKWFRGKKQRRISKERNCQLQRLSLE